MEGDVVQTMNTNVSKCKNDEIKKNLVYTDKT
jgi:hypothetical protein